MVIAPRYAKENAQKALGCISRGSDAMMRTGKLRANQLSNGQQLGKTSLTKMSQFKRHQKNAEYSGDICKDRGAVAWLGWGNGYKDGKPVPNASHWAKKQL